MDRRALVVAVLLLLPMGVATPASSESGPSTADEQSFKEEAARRLAADSFAVDLLEMLGVSFVAEDGGGYFEVELPAKRWKGRFADADGCTTFWRVGIPKVPGIPPGPLRDAYVALGLKSGDLLALKICGDATLRAGIIDGEPAAEAGGSVHGRAGTFLTFKPKWVGPQGPNLKVELYLQVGVSIEARVSPGENRRCTDGTHDRAEELEIRLRGDAAIFTKGKLWRTSWEKKWDLGYVVVQARLAREACTGDFTWDLGADAGAGAPTAQQSYFVPSDSVLNAWRDDGTLARLGLPLDTQAGTQLDLANPAVRGALGLDPASGSSAASAPPSCQRYATPEAPAGSGAESPAVVWADVCGSPVPDATGAKPGAEGRLAANGIATDVSLSDSAYAASQAVSPARELLSQPQVDGAFGLAAEPTDTSEEAVARRATRGGTWIRSTAEAIGATNYSVQENNPCQLSTFGVLSPLPGCDDEAFHFDGPRVALQGNELAVWQFDGADSHRVQNTTKPVTDAADNPVRHDGREDGAVRVKGRFRDGYAFDGSGARLLFDGAPTPSGEFTLFLWLRPGCSLGADCAAAQTVADWGSAGSIRVEPGSVVAARAGSIPLGLDAKACWVRGAWVPLLWAVAGGVERLALGNCATVRTASASVGSETALSLGASLQRDEGFQGALDEVYVWSGTPSQAVNGIVTGLQAYRPFFPSLRRVSTAAEATVAGAGAALDAVGVTIPPPPWNASDVVKFRVYRSEDPTNVGALVAELGAQRNATGDLLPARWLDTGVAYGKTYFYRVSAATSLREGELTPPIEVTAGFAKRLLPPTQKVDTVDETVAPVYVSKSQDRLEAPPLEVRGYFESPTSYCSEILLFQAPLSTATCMHPDDHPVKLGLDRVPDGTWQPTLRGEGSPTAQAELFYQYDPTHVNSVSQRVPADGSVVDATLALPPRLQSQQERDWLLSHPTQTALVVRVRTEDPGQIDLEGPGTPPQELALPPQEMAAEVPDTPATPALRPSRCTTSPEEAVCEFLVPYVGQILATSDETAAKSALLDDAVGATAKAVERAKQEALNQTTTEDNVAIVVRGESATPVTATLPTGRYATSAVWDGTNAYVFGGLDGSFLNQIVRYNPSTNTVTTMIATLPTVRHSTSAVWDGTNAYVFGGFDGSFLNQIVRYNPSTNTVTIMSATLPAGRLDTSAVWNGTAAYIFGGSDGTPSNQIVRYDPATDTVNVMSATLPTARYRTSAVWDGTNAYVFGGEGGPHLNQIVRYNPSTNTVTTMSATLPTARSWTSAVWDGTNAYVFGGCASDACPSNQIVRYNPTTNTVTTIAATLPTGRYATSAVWDGRSAYVFGGYSDGGISQIVRFAPPIGETSLGKRAYAATVWDGEYAYVFGGLVGSQGWLGGAAPSGGSPLNEIARYHPATNTVSIMSATLPSAREGTSAVWDGKNVYIFGGYNGGFLNQIVRYDPSTNTVTSMSATLPSGLYAASAVWDGQNAYIFGGIDGNSMNLVVRYNPVTDTATLMTATLPVNCVGASAVWDGQYAYIFGGHDCSLLAWAGSSEIVRYDPRLDKAAVVATLPGLRLQTSAVWDGRYAYFFGGWDPSSGRHSTEIVRYHPATNALTIVGGTLPTPRSGTAAIWGGQNAYVFGGCCDVDEIVRYSPAPALLAGAPQRATSTAGAT